ncbi:DUF4339 domain-containing protein [Bradyrhizobium sp. Pear77]|uniref:DUF4339 domain-containing protein n=1 Tax=Bradyrhizobium altum TaxID=1571202 RepID=UPI001E5A64E7|nr:DUF4339 domain-containing protein [Bradyrhizobium altum]MCC8957738.1 DUF4339 domain-containing protein [Bradyrhizobium altum]
MTDQISAMPPPIPNENEWYYSDNGARKGPVSASAIRELLAKKKLDSTDQVWRRGMKDWQSIRDSDLGALVNAEPPPLSGAQVSNTLVWIVAFIPMIFGIIDIALASDPSISFARAVSQGGGLPWKEREVPLLAYTVVYGLLCIWDEYRLEKAGYSKGVGMKFLALFIVPVYLFVRANKLKQRPTYAITWVVLFVLFLFLVAAAQS